MRRTPHLLASLLLGSCSTLAELPDPQECESDLDCPEPGEKCAPDTRICVPGGDLPPRADLAFDIQELVGGSVVFRAEIAGCDREVEFAQSQLRLRAAEIEQTFELEAIADPKSPQPDPPVVGGRLGSTLELTQASRFARPPLLPPRITYPTVDATTEPPTELPTVVRWPRYHPLDAQPPVFEDGGFVVWRTIPNLGAPVIQMLAPPQLVPLIDEQGNTVSCVADTDCCELDDTGEACEPDDPNVCFEDVGLCTAIGNPRFAFSFVYEERCALELKGNLRKIDGETLAPLGELGDVPLTIRYADTPDERLGVHAIDGVAIEDRPAQCTSDDDCIEGEQFCDTETSPGAGQCVLALAGRPADSGSLVTAPNFLPPEMPEGEPMPNPDAGSFTANLYTYCDAGENIGYLRSFTISASPPGPVAALSYTFDVSVAPLVGSTHPQETLLKNLCVPDWGASNELSLRLVGKPVSLLGSGADEYICCDVGCLPASADVATVEPTQLTSCDGRPTASGGLLATVSASLVLDEDQLDAWDGVDCQPPDTGPGGVVGGIRRQMDCSDAVTDATCTAPDLAAGKDGSPREYELRLESPTGSLFQSKITTVQVDGSTTPQEIKLDRRVLVRGRVLLDGATCEEAAPIDGDCGSEGAIVRAERLRMPGETEANTVGPHFHEVTTYFDPVSTRQGGYILPLDPGVYLLTALPLSGSRGGPATISWIDVRDVDTLENDLVLTSGQLVTLDLTEFDPRAQIIPFDRGSWRNLDHPGRMNDPDPTRRFVDLNAIGECWQEADDPPQGCRIRRLISGASLSASQVGQVRFTARRDVDAPSCPN